MASFAQVARRTAPLLGGLVPHAARPMPAACASRSFSIFSPLKIDDKLDMKNLISAASWTKEELEGVEQVHKKPMGLAKKAAFASVKIARTGFDIVSLYQIKRARGTFTEKDWIRRIIFLETVAGVPGMIAAMVRHLHSLRLMRRDYGWIHSLLAEAENERMHLLISLNLRQPGIFFRSAVIATQAVFLPFYSLAYLVSPKFCHSFVGYLEEEAVYTYTKLLEDIDAGKLPAFSNTRAPRMARVYYDLPRDAMLRDVFMCIRADESAHRDTNHHFSDIRADEPNTLVEHLRKSHFQNQSGYSGLVDAVVRVKEQALMEEFKRWDLDNSGYISMDEVQQTIASRGESMTEAELKSMIKTVDTDQDGRISYQEFVKMMH